MWVYNWFSLKRQFLQKVIKKARLLYKTGFEVTPEGFEPSTNRAEICYSIQLNYGAKYFANIVVFECNNLRLSLFLSYDNE